MGKLVFRYNAYVSGIEGVCKNFIDLQLSHTDHFTLSQIPNGETVVVCSKYIPFIIGYCKLGYCMPGLNHKIYLFGIIALGKNTLVKDYGR